MENVTGATMAFGKGWLSLVAIHVLPVSYFVKVLLDGTTEELVMGVPPRP